MTISQRITARLAFVSTIFAIFVFRMVYFYPGRSIPLTELVGTLGALLLFIPFICMRRLSTLHGTTAVAVPCINWGLAGCILWMSGNRTLAVLVSLLSLWYAIDWIKVVRNSERRAKGKSEHPERDKTNGA
jgi:hypothetical protein